MKPAEQRKISAGIANNPFTRTMKGQGKTESLSGALHRNKIIHSLRLKPWDTYESKAGNCQRNFRITDSYLSPLVLLSFLTVCPYQRKWVNEVSKLTHRNLRMICKLDPLALGAFFVLFRFCFLSSLLFSPL
uniref:Uncharacterized protein n=1 Tax=Rousettus aegyptiacus TaxID=9407 RepID=A0A7J8HS78_ROUAE|nr:hypothetical protein HJG63_010909 [Rousettus aegyptiacus]